MKQAFVQGLLVLTLLQAARGETIVSNIGTNLPALPSAGAPELVRADDPRPCVAQLFALPADGTSFWLSNVVLPLRHSGTGTVKAVLTLWSSIVSPGSSATAGLPMPDKPLAWLATRHFDVRFAGHAPFAVQPAVALQAGKEYWIVLMWEEQSPGAFIWERLDRHTNYSYREDGPGQLYWREQRNTPGDDYLPDQWIPSSIKTAAALGLEGSPALQLSLTVRTNGPTEIHLRGAPGLNVALETSSGNDWGFLANALLTNGTANYIDQPPPGSSQRFYRLRLNADAQQ